MEREKTGSRLCCKTERERKTLTIDYPPKGETEISLFSALHSNGGVLGIRTGTVLRGMEKESVGSSM